MFAGVMAALLMMLMIITKATEIKTAMMKIIKIKYITKFPVHKEFNVIPN